MAAISAGIDKNTKKKKKLFKTLLDLTMLGLLTSANGWVDTPTQRTGIQHSCCQSLLTDQGVRFAGCV